MPSCRKTPQKTPGVMMPKIDIRDLPEHVVSRGEDALGGYERLALGDAGGLTQFGVALETLAPGARSSDRHWHEAEDEFLWMVAGEAVLIEETGETPLRPGDAVTWKAGEANGHMLHNRSDAPCQYLVVGTRAKGDVVHYPDLGRARRRDADGHWVLTDRNGEVLESGTA